MAKKQATKKTENNRRVLTLRLDNQESIILNKLMEAANTKVASTALMYGAENCTRYKKLYEDTVKELDSAETKYRELDSRVKVFNAAFKELAEISQSKNLQLKIK